MRYIIFKQSTGEVLRTLSCPIETIQLNCQYDEDYIAYLSENLDVHVEVVDGIKTIKPGRIDSRSDEEKSRIKWYEIRKQRDQLLAETDWVSSRYLDQTGAIPDEWRAYRQALRDVTSQSAPHDIKWPVMPPL